ncbi:MAG: FHA domain-containing protein [Thermoplasmata archaeon]
MARVEFPDGSVLQVVDSLVLGREDFKGLVRDEEINLVSRKQMRIFREGNIYFVEDGHAGQPSSNGTKLNGQDVTGMGKQPLRDGDTIVVADVLDLVVHIT